MGGAKVHALVRATHVEVDDGEKRVDGGAAATEQQQQQQRRVRVYEPRNSPYAARIIYKQVAEYFRSGILDDVVAKRDVGERNVTVFDVGANIGMFALEVMRRTHGEADVFCFEPLPATFAVLKQNVDNAIDPESTFRGAGSKVRTLPYGLSNTDGKVSFAYRPHAPECSSMYDPSLLKGDRTEMTREEEIEHFTDKAYDANFPLWKDHPMAYCFVKTVYPRFMLRAGVAHWLDRYNKTEQVEARLRRMSDVIREHGVERIDLLKIDVELAELDVLRGIDDCDWPKIQVVVIEVHDIDGRLEHITALLREHGVRHIKVYQEDGMAGSNIHHLCARRLPFPDDQSH